MGRSPVNLSRADARRALVSYQLRRGTLPEVFENLKSVQYDPLAPAGCNHDLVLRARVPGYKIGDWQRAAYGERLVYDGWDKQASLVRMEGWPMRRVFYQWHGKWLMDMSRDYGSAVDSVLKELDRRGPLTPRELEFQEHRSDWKGSWYGPNVTKHVLRALWHSGRIMTHSRRGQQHVYDLVERVVPARLIDQPLLSESAALESLLFDRMTAIGLLRPTAPYEIWSIPLKVAPRKAALKALGDSGQALPVSIEGISALTTEDFLRHLDKPAKKGVEIIAPLDHLMWDRKLVAELFGFDYRWEVYTKEAKRKWGYYVLPVLFDDQFVGRFDVWCRNGVLEVRAWHWEGSPPKARRFWDSFEKAVKGFMAYSGAGEVRCCQDCCPQVREAVSRL